MPSHKNFNFSSSGVESNNMLQRNIKGTCTDYYSIASDGAVILSIQPLLSDLDERMKNEAKYGAGFFDVALNDFIDECEGFFKKSPRDIWEKIKEEIIESAPSIIKSHQTIDTRKPIGLLGTIVITALVCTAFGVAAYLMIPLLD
ncbi:hypothetical protein [Providencia sp. PROV214]|uniref:hypothetical protein n=1 Tax=Providencia sp. PROV214 TaxID=2949910 RepID=UPI00234BD860|nr:hypothetical protein [Providencia sp. PROV214]